MELSRKVYTLACISMLLTVSERFISASTVCSEKEKSLTMVTGKENLRKVLFL